MAELPPEELLDVVRDILIASGPLSEEALTRQLRARGVTIVDDGWFDSLLEETNPLIMPVGAGIFAWLPTVLEGRVFTHRLTSAEASLDFLAMSGDLVALEVLVGEPPYDHLTGGSDATYLHSLDTALLAERAIPAKLVAGGAILLSPGTLAGIGVGEGSLVGVSARADGLAIVAVPEAEAVGNSVGEALAELVAESSEEPHSLEFLLWSVFAHDDSLLRSAEAPLDEQLKHSGLERRGALVAVEGLDFDVKELDFGAVGMAERLEEINEIYGLHEVDALAVYTLLTAHDDLAAILEETIGNGAESGAEALLQDLSELADPEAPASRFPGLSDLAIESSLERLREPVVAEAFLQEALASSSPEDDVVVTEALRMLVDFLEQGARRSERVVLRWLSAMVLEAQGQVLEAEESLWEAEGLEPGWEPVLLTLARYASDRGDAERGLSLLRRAGAEGHQLFELLEAFQPRTGPELPRNAPCWCGSGRKFKQCHMRGSALPLEERAAWLYQKSSFDLSSRYAMDVYALAKVRAQFWGDSTDAFVRAVSDPLVGDVVLFEGGAFEDFLGARGDLLPADEAMMAQQWLLVDRSLFEVTDVCPGEGLTVRDVRTGDVVEIRERTASRTVKTGQYYCMRVVPAGETMQIFGGLEPISLMEREPLLELLDDEDTSPEELVAFLSQRFAPPVIRNTEGEDTVFCEATFRITRPKGLPAFLDDRFGPSSEPAPGERRWVELVVTEGLERVRSEFRLVGRELQVTANSLERFKRAIAVVREADPAAKVLTEKRETFEDVRRSAADAPKGGGAKGGDPFGLAGAGGSSGSIDPASTPEVAAALDDMVRKWEQDWLDEAIPALGGRTPRECVADPTRRDDVIRLLNSFPEATGPGMMNPARIRGALGLD